MSTLAETGTLIRMVLRRDRVRLPIWIVAIVVTVVGTAAALPESFPTAEARQARAELVDGPAIRMLVGPAFGTDDYSYGAMLHNEVFGTAAVAVALMSIFTLVRHTRAEEEAGRLELVRSAPVGRHAGLTAALVVVTGANLIIGALLALLLPPTISTLSVEGSMLFAAAVTTIGLVFASVAAVMVQVNEFARAATGTSAALMGIAYAVRGFGDVNENFLSWLSPFGWGMQTAPWVLNRWWPLLLSLGLVAMLVPLAYALSVRRDVGAGLTRPRPGTAHASRLLSAPLAMPMRLQRGSIIGWTIGIVLFGIGIGSVAPSMTDLIEESPQIEQMIAQMGGTSADLVDAILSVYILFFALVTSIFTVSSIVRMRSEEASGRAENILATPVSRLRWAGEYLAVSVIVSTAILILAGLGAGITFATTAGTMEDVWRVTAASLAYAPALWLTAGVALLVFGLAPKWIGLAWIVPVYAFVAVILLPLFGLPEGFGDLSPFAHVPELLISDPALVPMLVLSGLAVISIVIGVGAFRHRDLAM